jgi:hypothetical protein
MRTYNTGRNAPQVFIPRRGYGSACRGTIAIWVVHTRIIAHRTVLATAITRPGRVGRLATGNHTGHDVAILTIGLSDLR